MTCRPIITQEFTPHSHHPSHPHPPIQASLIKPKRKSKSSTPQDQSHPAHSPPPTFRNTIHVPKTPPLSLPAILSPLNLPLNPNSRPLLPLPSPLLPHPLHHRPNVPPRTRLRLAPYDRLAAPQHASHTSRTGTSKAPDNENRARR